MERLEKDWLTDGLIDFEYKKYLMLAYMQHVEKDFCSNKLYPALGELVAHYQNLMDIKRGKDGISDLFPKDVDGVDVREKKIIYRDFEDSEELKFISEILEFAIPHFQEKIETGKSIYEFVEENLTIEPVGVLPIYRDEGYVLLEDSRAHDILIYQYKTSIIESSSEKYRALKTNFLFREKKSLANTIEQLKIGLTKRFKEMPNPATWVVHSSFGFPLVETYLPVTKRLLMRELARA